MKKRFLIFFVIVICHLPALAQTNWTIYDTTNSPLPDNIVYKVLEDNSGNIWAATQKGLVKFDGVNWTIYDTVPGTSYVLENLFALSYDKINDYIYVSKPGILIRFDGINWNTWYHYAYSVENIVDSQGRVWMALYNKGVGVFDGNTITYYDTTNSPIQSPFVHDIELDLNGVAWILSGLGVTRFDGTNWMVYDTSNSPLPSNGIFGIGVDLNNVLWVHGETNLNEAFIYSFDGSTWTPFDTAICQPLHAYSYLEPDAMNHMWIGTYGEGLQMVTSSTCSTYTTLNSPLPTDYLLDVFVTASQTLWLTTYSEGLIKADLPVGLPEAEVTQTLQIIPNPADSKITIKNVSGKKITIYSILGEEVYAATLPISTRQDIEVDVVSLPAGVYTVKTEAGISKLLIQ